ncbi:MAG: hypothetical protein N2749_02345 [Clostridia bacterium]|nr:hypothetical protein [Clostridia bacterium]
MDSLNQVELQNIRHICGMCSNLCSKIEYYKTLSTDQNLLDVFQKVCDGSKSLKEDLCNML